MSKVTTVTRKFTKKTVVVPPQENEGLHIVPQKSNKVVKMNYKKGCFDPKKDSLSFFNKGGSKSSQISDGVSKGGNVNRRGSASYRKSI